jgi:hypothetical protein
MTKMSLGESFYILNQRMKAFHITPRWGADPDYLPWNERIDVSEAERAEIIAKWDKKFEEDRIRDEIKWERREAFINAQKSFA